MSQPGDNEYGSCSVREDFVIHARQRCQSAKCRPAAEDQQALDLAKLMRNFPQLAAVRQYIENEPRFETYSCRVHVFQEQIREGFMVSRPGVLHGAVIIADLHLVRRFDRQDIGLERFEESEMAINSHLNYICYTDAAAA